MSLPSRLSVWSAVELTRHRRVGDLLDADDDVHRFDSGSSAPAHGAPRTGLRLTWTRQILARPRPPGRASRSPGAYRSRSVDGRSVDLLVVGAGPAGTRRRDHGPRRRARRPRSSTRRRSPATRPAATASPTGALRLLEDLGVEVPAHRDRPRRSPRPCSSPRSAAGCRSRSPSERTAATRRSSPRLDLDAALVARTRGAGRRDPRAHARSSRSDDATTRGSTPTLGRRDQRTLRARFVVAADGHYSRRAPPARPRRTRPTSASGTRSASTSATSTTPGSGCCSSATCCPGYAWVFPLPGGRANVGFGVLRDRGLERHASSRRCGATCSTRPSLRSVLGPSAEPEAPHRAWPIPTATRPRRARRRRRPRALRGRRGAASSTR